VVCADARLPDVEELGLDHAGVRLGDDSRVTVDQQQRTCAAGIYAAGDVTGPPWLTNRAVAAGTGPAATRSGEPEWSAASACLGR
jgi:pyruvate/2-oxoglutarate dehydrogenase complex dihydrolipoamide dehydrogenase (E3) component